MKSNSPFTPPMDSQNSSAPPSHHVPPPPSHPAAVLPSPHSQSQQHHQPNTSYPLATSSNAVNPTTTSATIMQHQNPGFTFNSMTGPKPADHLQPDGGFNTAPARKKRGRPRKYPPGNSIGLGLSPAPVSQTPPVMARNDSAAASGSGGGTPSSETSSKRNRGRPPSSVKLQLDALGAPGVGFTPHVIMVDAGEDIASKIMAFCRQGRRSFCVLSAYGVVSNATLYQVAMSGGTVTYEGRLQIISLSGSFLLSESNGNRGRSWSLIISLAGPDHKVIGAAGVAGMLTAAEPVQVILGSFIAERKKSKSGPSSNTPDTGTGTSPSPGGSNESGEENDDSPLNQGPGSYGNTGRPGQTMPMRTSMAWPNSRKGLPS